jgi:DNA-binding response OmpR family regulator
MLEASRHRIVVAEDDPSTLDLIRTRLELAGFPTAFARDGREALKTILAVQPSCAVLDLNMPGLGGFGVLEALQTHARGRRIPVLVLTGRSSKDDLAACLKLGAMDYLTKPFDERVLLRRVARLVQGQPRQRSREITYI